MTKKIKVSNFDPKDHSLEKIKEKNLRLAKDFFSFRPFATKLYVSIHTKLPLSFISDNWKEITGGK